MQIKPGRCELQFKTIGLFFSYRVRICKGSRYIFGTLDGGLGWGGALLTPKTSLSHAESGRSRSNLTGVDQ